MQLHDDPNISQPPAENVRDPRVPARHPPLNVCRDNGGIRGAVDDLAPLRSGNFQRRISLAVPRHELPSPAGWARRDLTGNNLPPDGVPSMATSSGSPVNFCPFGGDCAPSRETRKPGWRASEGRRARRNEGTPARALDKRRG